MRIAAHGPAADNRVMADEGRGHVLAFPQAPEAIELKQLRAFVAVADELNFGRAADRLHISQPALSRQVRALEQLLGLELLRRTKHRVELTIAGEALLDRARRLLDDVDEAVTATLAIGASSPGGWRSCGRRCSTSPTTMATSRSSGRPTSGSTPSSRRPRESRSCTSTRAVFLRSSSRHPAGGPGESSTCTAAAMRWGPPSATAR
jgi:DNA-binding MarR family transcriptional regulator